MLSLFIIDDDPEIRSVLEDYFSELKYDVTVFESAEAAIPGIYRDHPDIILLDLQLPGMDGLGLLAKLKKELPDIEVVMITGYADVSSAVEAMKLGARDYIKKPFVPEELAVVVEKVREIKENADHLAYLRQEQQNDFDLIIGNSKPMQTVYKFVQQISKSSRTTILICGETGTGKGLLARSIHYNSPRADKPFVEINCSAFQPNLLESELFGYEAGAFTGAKQRKKGLMEMAHTGTFFLDEIGDMSLELQAKILKVLEEKTFRRVGGTKEIVIDTRIISASSKDLVKCVKDGAFRQDLYYRLNVATVELPPLRNRKKDIILLAQHFINIYNREFSKSITGLTESAEKALYDYPWTGNVRELRNLIERAVLFEGAKEISLGNLNLTTSRFNTKEENRVNIPENGISLDQIEKELIEKALEKAKGNKSKTARLLGLTRETLKYRLKKYELG